MKGATQERHLGAMQRQGGGQGPSCVSARQAPLTGPGPQAGDSVCCWGRAGLGVPGAGSPCPSSSQPAGQPGEVEGRQHTAPLARPPDTPRELGGPARTGPDTPLSSVRCPGFGTPARGPRPGGPALLLPSSPAETRLPCATPTGSSRSQCDGAGAPRTQSPPSPALSTPARSVVWVPVRVAAVMGLKCD